MQVRYCEPADLPALMRKGTSKRPIGEKLYGRLSRRECKLAFITPKNKQEARNIASWFKRNQTVYKVHFRNGYKNLIIVSESVRLPKV